MRLPGRPRKYHSEEERREAVRVLDRARYAMGRHKAYPKDPEKATARQILNRAVRRGEIVKPAVCSQCNRGGDYSRIEAHHDDYSRPLDVVWLCAVCHRRKHNQEVAA